MHPLFDDIPSVPLDPIMRLFEAYNHDPSPNKLNLVVGVYTDENGRIPVLRAVREAERIWIEKANPKSYRPIEGTPDYRAGVQALLFGGDSPIITAGRAATLQSIGGTGALKVGADVLHRLLPGSTVAVSSPSWENHRALFEAAGFKVQDYPYYDAATHGVNFDAMLDAIRALPSRSIVVLHACCHNPTGNDLTPDQWRVLADVVVRQELVPFVDIAYQGFGDGLAEDALAVRLFAERCEEFFVASSFSKSFSLYGERVGALTIVARNAVAKGKVEALAKRLVRTNYSNPPTHGAVIVESVLQTPALRQAWEEELAGMRQRIRRMRGRLADGLAQLQSARKFDFIKDQKGMFSYSGLSAAEASLLRTKHEIYALETGRICVAALNDHNIDRVINAVVDVLEK